MSPNITKIRKVVSMKKDIPNNLSLPPLFRYSRHPDTGDLILVKCTQKDSQIPINHKKLEKENDCKNDKES